MLQPTPVPPAVLLAREAMNTRFELALHGPDPVRLRAAGEQALDEIERIEARLSLFRTDSEISAVNAFAARRPVRVSPPTFALLLAAQQLHRETEGAFDPTLAPLLDAWGLLGRSDGRMPSRAERDAARSCSGMHLVALNPADCTVRFTVSGMRLDLGAIGKGHAVDEAVSLLREAGVSSALLHAGSSSIYALGAPPGAEAWPVAIEGPPAPAGKARETLAVLALRDVSLGVSAVWGKSFAVGGRTFGHVLDPRTGAPAHRARIAAVVLPTATESDALSTALLVGGPEALASFAERRPGLSALVAAEGAAGLEVVRLGL